MKSVRIITQSEKEDVNSPKIGIFWFVPANIIDENPVLLYALQAIEQASHADIFYDSTYEHYALWNTVQKMFSQLKNVPYEKYPRGRVTMIAKEYPIDGTFKLMADIKILQNKECVKEIERIFNLSDEQNIEILRDAHYQT